MAQTPYIRILFFLTLSTVSFAAPIRVGLVLDKGGRDDKSFNSAAYRGAQEAKKKGSVEVKDIVASDDASIEPSLRKFAQLGYDLVIGIGFVQAAPLSKVAKDFPKIRFLIIDSPVEMPNVRSIVFNEHEGAYLVGAIAALFSKSHVVGFVGGMDIPLIRRFELGYRKGAEDTVKKTRVLSQYVGTSSEAWRNPTKGKELALSQYNAKVDVIFAAAGASGLGVFDAAEEQKKFVIGVDSNQNGLKPGYVLTSMLKRVDLAVEEAIELIVKNQFQSGKFTRGLEGGHIDFAMDSYNRSLLTLDIESKANSIKKRIADKEIRVPDYYVNKTQ